MTDHLLQEKRWEKLALALEKVQSLVFKSHENKTEDLFYNLAELELPFPKNSLSILYRPYGEESLKILVYKGKVFRKNPVKTSFNFNEESIIQELSNTPTIKRQIKYLKTKEECQREGIKNSHSAILCPIRLSSQKNMGVFILSNSNTGKQLEGFGGILHNLSDRMAYYIRHNVRKRRNHYFEKAQYELLQKDFKTGKEIINAYLKKMEGWFTEDKVHLLLKHPLDTTKFVLATQDNRLVKNWRHAPDPQPVKDLSAYLRQDKELSGDVAKEALTLNTKKDVKSFEITGNYSSYAAAPIQLKSKVILGYVVITNNIAEQAFEYDEGQSIDTFSDFIAQLIGIYRDDLFWKSQRAIREFELEIQQNHEERLSKLYEQVAKHISSMYGAKELAILRYTHSNLGLVVENKNSQLQTLLSEPTDEQKKQNLEIPRKEKRYRRSVEFTEEQRKKDPEKAGKFYKKYFDTLYEAILDIITSSHKENKPKIEEEKVEVAKKQIQPLTIHDQINKISYFVSPMRTKTHSAGCFVIPANNIGNHTASSIDDISDTLGIKLDGYGRWKRYHLLNKFCKEISRLESPNEKKVIHLAQDFISQAMYTDNLYIALYDINSQVIRFPLALKNSKKWEDIQGTERNLDSNSRGKTEEIILTGEPILHRTKNEAIEWYKRPNHRDYAETPLASWVGVPIFSDKGVVGVIATYHDKLDYIFSERDLFFLQQISFSVSGMLRTLEISTLNQAIQLEEETARRLTLRKIENIFSEKLTEIHDSIETSIDEIKSNLSDNNWFPNIDIINEMLEQASQYTVTLTKKLLELKDINNEVGFREINIYSAFQQAIKNENKEINKNIKENFVFRDKTDRDHARKSKIFVDEYELDSALHLILSELIIFSQGFDEKIIYSYRIISTEQEISLKIYSNNAPDIMSEIYETINIKRANQIIRGLNSGSLKLESEENKFKFNITIKRSKTKLKHYILIKTIAYAIKVKKILAENDTNSEIIRNIEDIKNQDDVSLITDYNTGELILEHSDWWSEKFSKIYIVYSHESEKILPSDDRIVFLDREKLLQENYLVSNI